MTCAGCTHARLRFFPHRPEYSPYCKIWDQLIDTDDPACPHFNPDAYLGPVITDSGRSSSGGQLWPERVDSDPNNPAQQLYEDESKEKKGPEGVRQIRPGDFTQFNVLI